jgi:hypothetical protein
MGLRHVITAALLFLAAAAVSAESTAPCAHERALSAKMTDIAREQPAYVGATLERIDGTGRRLLALRSYLRSADSITDRWSWSREEIDAFDASDEQRGLLAEIDRVRARFEAANPGYQLYANTAVRSLDLQLERWNSNPSVAALSADLLRAACAKSDVSASAAALGRWLRAWIPSRPAPLAAPGLSAHGRARAIDFQVHRRGRVVAGPEIASIPRDWVAAGWGAKVAAAVKTGSSRFIGPLAQPNEPWHFEYRP